MAANRWDDLTDREIRDLDHDAIERWIDIECAHEGIPLLPPRPVEPVLPEQPEKDGLVYEVEGICFLDEAEAQAVRSALAQCRTVVEFHTWSDSPPKPRMSDAICCNVHRYYTPSTRAASKAVIEEAKALKAEYASAKKEYDEIEVKRSRISSEIRERVEDVLDLARDVRRLRDEFGRYLDLADGDRSAAEKFFRLAFGEKFLDVTLQEAMQAEGRKEATS